MLLARMQRGDEKLVQLFVVSLPFAGHKSYWKWHEVSILFYKVFMTEAFPPLTETKNPNLNLSYFKLHQNPKEKSALV